MTDDEPLLPVREIEKTIYDDLPEPVAVKTKSSINVTIESSITLYDFEIKQIMIVPSTSATLTITIRTSPLPVEKTIYLIGDAYLAWSSCDDYLYDYIRENIHTIYNL